MFKTKVEKTWEGKIYVGSVRGYNGKPFDLATVQDEIRVFQEARREADITSCAVRITATTYQFGTYSEAGWEIAVIQYPRYPVWRHDLLGFCQGLAGHLLRTLNQNRVTLVAPMHTFLYEAEDAESQP